MPQRDLYETLGVKRDATHDEIRKVYRKLARKHHPDVNPGDSSASDRFKEISAAHEVLGDARRRKEYDEFGDAAMRSGFDADKARQYQAQAEAAQQSQASQARQYHADSDGGPGNGFGNVDFDLGDLFGGGGGGGGGRGRARRRGTSPGEDVIARVDLDLATALRGAELSVDAPTGKPCPTCNGAGHVEGACARCNGVGRVAVGGDGPMRIAAICPECGGSGHPVCGTCHGSGSAAGTRSVTVRIPAGADEGSRLRVAGLGRPGHGGGPPGDLYIEVHLRAHRFFRRDGLDLHLSLPITVGEAYSGVTIDVPTPEGSVALKVPPRSQTGQKLRLRGKGARRGAESGDLYCELVVKLPDQADPGLAEALRAAASLYTQPVREGIAL